MREAFGLAAKSSSQPQCNRLDKHEFEELVKRGSTVEDMGAGHSEAAWVHGIDFSRYKNNQVFIQSLKCPIPGSLTEF